MADRTARFLEDSKVDLLNGVAYYNQRTAGAGERLLEDVFETHDIARDGNIDIVAVAHDKRAPGYFRGRTK